MRDLTSDRNLLRVLIVLAIGQLVGWGTVSLPAVVGGQMAADLHMSIAAVFAGTSVLYVVMGICGPLLARAFKRYGARHVMIAGTAAAAPGFLLLAMAGSSAQYFAAWIVLGMAGAAMLSTAAYILLNEVAGSGAKSAIGALMLVTGLSSSIFWPTTALLSQMAGWRATCLFYGAATLLVCLPLYAFGLPRRTVLQGGQGSRSGIAAAASVTPVAARSTFYLIAAAVALNAFVTFGFSAVLIEFLKSDGLAASEAVAFASMLGVIQVGARGIDFLGGGRWDGVTTAIAAGSIVPVAMLVLLIGGGHHWSIAAFILLYGLGSGALAVARATMPLAFYDRADYAQAASRLALPLNFISALSPPLMAGLLVHSGGTALLVLAMVCSCLALAINLMLSARRPGVVAASA